MDDALDEALLFGYDADKVKRLAEVEALLADGVTPILDGFTARNGRTYKGQIEVKDRYQGKGIASTHEWVIYDIELDNQPDARYWPNKTTLRESTEHRCAAKTRFAPCGNWGGGIYSARDRSKSPLRPPVFLISPTASTHMPRSMALHMS